MTREHPGEFYGHVRWTYAEAVDDDAQSMHGENHIGLKPIYLPTSLTKDLKEQDILN
jgi:hypothetical protein